MGMDAELLAVGNFSKSIVDCLEYPANFYDDTPDGSLIITHVCNSVTSRGSELLAESLGISPRQFERHVYIAGVHADLAKLREAIEDIDGVRKFVLLREAGFMFHYLPNG